MKEVKKFSLTLFIICVGASFLLSSVHALTKPQIEKQKKDEELNGLREVLPEAKDFTAVEKDGNILYYKAANAEGKTIGYAFKALGKGYSSVIETIVGMTPEGKITNIKIINQNETPGLGSRITEVKQTATVLDKITGKAIGGGEAKPWFQAQFSNKPLDQFNTIDTISGATISSSAVISSVKQKSQEILQLIKNKNE